MHHSQTNLIGRSRTFVFLAVLIGLGCLSSNCARAVTYSGYAATAGSPGNTTVTGAPATYSASNLYGDSAGSSSSNDHGGTLTAFASGHAGAGAAMNYTFQVVGTPDTYVPLNVGVRGYTNASGDSDQSMAFFELYYTSPLDLQYQSHLSAQANAGSGNLPGHSDLILNKDISVLSDTILYVSFYVNAFSGLPSKYTAGFADAFLDPVFLIDPAYANRFTVVGVPGAGLPPPVGRVPEPASWTMMITGFGVLGIAMRRRRPRNYARLACFAAGLATLIKRCSRRGVLLDRFYVGR